MFHYLFGSLFLVVTVMCFQHQYCIHGALNAYYGLYKGIVESSVIAFDGEGNKIEPYFNLDVLSFRLRSYFKENLEPYCRDYNFYYVSDYYPTGKGPKKFDLHLWFKISDIRSVSKIAIFDIRRNEYE